MDNITEIKEEKKRLIKLKREKKRLILESKQEITRLHSTIKDESIAKKKAYLFASHYTYLGIENKRAICLISTLLFGLFLKSYSSVLFFLPYILWIGYDINRMGKLVKKQNDSINEQINEIEKTINEQEREIEEITNKRITEINEILSNHENVKEAIGHTIKFLERFNKKAS